MKNKIVIIYFILTAGFASAQLKNTQSAYVSFYSEMEDVLAENYSGESELNTVSGKLTFSFAIQSFYFENATMQKHFNETDVMNSKEFQRAKFSGNITNNKIIRYDTDGEYKVSVKGELTIKGTTNEIATKAIIKISQGKIFASATFTIDRFKYGVDGKESSISQILDLTVKAEYE